MPFPVKCGLHELTQNVEGLRAHATLLNIFGGGPAEVTEEQRKWCIWLVHCLLKAARHYNEARGLVLAQMDESTRTPEEAAKGRGLPLFDFALEMEDCITSLDKAIVCIQGLQLKSGFTGAHVAALATDCALLRDFRNKQEHLHKLMAAGQTGKGPLMVTVTADGEGMRLLKLSMSFDALHRLIDAAYRDIATLVPGHDTSSAPSPTGTLVLSGGAIVEFFPGDATEATS